MELKILINNFLVEHDLPSLEEEKEAFKAIAELFYFYTGKISKVSLPIEIAGHLQYESDELVFFAGTFDPFHEGHLECLKKCPKQNIVIIPDINPWKENQSRVAPILKTYLNLISEAKYCVFPGFLALNRPNPTVDWITKLHVKRKFLLMGADNFIALEKWKEPDRLFNALTGLYVLSRKVDHDHIKKHSEHLKNKYHHLQIEFIEDNPYQEISSTSLRKNN
jgi:nicotinate-nucleotide adenylyltransferase